MSNKNYAIVLAAGKSTRMGLEQNKIYLPLLGKPVLAHTLEAFYASDLIHGIVVVVSQGQQNEFNKQVLTRYPSPKPLIVTEGGAQRQDSVYEGLEALPKDAGIVVIHDGARPLITSKIIHESIIEAQIYGGVVAGMPVKDTIKQVHLDLFVNKTLDRSALWQVQTPQTFQLPLIKSAHEKAKEMGFLGTDDAMLVEHMGKRVKMIEGGYENIKITTLEDLEIASRFLEKREGIDQNEDRDWL